MAVRGAPSSDPVLDWDTLMGWELTARKEAFRRVNEDRLGITAALAAVRGEQGMPLFTRLLLQPAAFGGLPRQQRALTAPAHQNDDLGQGTSERAAKRRRLKENQQKRREKQAKQQKRDSKDKKLDGKGGKGGGKDKKGDGVTKG